MIINIRCTLLRLSGQYSVRINTDQLENGLASLLIRQFHLELHAAPGTTYTDSQLLARALIHRQAVLPATMRRYQRLHMEVAVAIIHLLVIKINRPHKSKSHQLENFWFFNPHHR